MAPRIDGGCAPAALSAKPTLRHPTLPKSRTIMSQTTNLIDDSLRLPADAIGYSVSRSLRALFPSKAVVDVAVSRFSYEQFAHAELCTLEPRPDVHCRKVVSWHGLEYGLVSSIVGGWYKVGWQGHELQLLIFSWSGRHGPEHHGWLIADTNEICWDYYRTVCEWSSEIRGEVLVFDSGCWRKSKELYQAIRSATFDNLVLPGKTGQEILADFQQFFASRDLYERYELPWKRGVLFLGPPGNGKTHTVKALINRCGQPCLYVKSFKAPYGTDHTSIAAVFERARETKPCILVLEDLDSLINDKNRSFFLNELDGFAANTGILTLATTNHPERLDPAILNRPSRFDRKYHFELPGPDERRRYLSAWNARVAPEMQVDGDGLEKTVAETDQYSFAYLKELWLSSMMAWIATAEPGAMNRILCENAGVLRSQLSSTEEGRHEIETDEDDEDDDY
jgi:DNA replication protein DnaC